MEDNKLTKEEKFFCELYGCGEAPYGGNALKCYQEAFNDHKRGGKVRVSNLLARPEIQEYLNELETLAFEEARYMKKFLKENLMSIVEYCATSEFYNKEGGLMSPAPLRSVAVAASKALMELYPIKEAQRQELSINGGNGEGGITFNVIMPDAAPKGKEAE